MHQERSKQSSNHVRKHVRMVIRMDGEKKDKKNTIVKGNKLLSS